MRKQDDGSGEMEEQITLQVALPLSDLLSEYIAANQCSVSSVHDDTGQETCWRHLGDINSLCQKVTNHLLQAGALAISTKTKNTFRSL